MELLLNNKSFENWKKEELELILNNREYAENNYIDYKKTLSFVEIEENRRKEKIAEFKHDICSFANSEGGYIFFGITEEKGVPIDLNGIEIPNENIDKYELTLRNHLIGILPSIPSVYFNFVKVKNNIYVVCMKINRSNFTPMVYKENENNYKFWLRRGNGKTSMSYEEIRNMFNQSLTFSAHLKEFANERKRVAQETEDSDKLFVVHIIPENFFNVKEHKKIYIELRKTSEIQNIFSSFCIGTPYPNIDGAVYSEFFYSNGKKVQFFNNGAVELLLDLSKFIKLRKETNRLELASPILLNELKKFVTCFYNANHIITNSRKIYVLFQMIGCKDIVSAYDWGRNDISTIDRNYIQSEIYELDDIFDKTQCDELLILLEREFALSISLKYTRTYDSTLQINNN